MVWAAPAAIKNSELNEYSTGHIRQPDQLSVRQTRGISFKSKIDDD